MNDRLLTAAEVADQLRVSTMTIYRLIRRGELAAVRVGRNYRVRAGDLDRYLDAQLVDPATVDLDELARDEFGGSARDAQGGRRFGAAEGS